MALKIKATGTYQEIVTLAEAKSHLRVKNSSEDTLIATYLSAAIQWAEGFCHRVFRQNTYEAKHSSFDFELQHPPITALTSVEYKANGSYTTIDAANYYLDEADGGISSKVCFVDDFVLSDIDELFDAVKVTYTSGFTAATLPDNIKVAIYLKLENLYNNREEENKRFTTSAEMLLMPYKIFSV